MGLGLTLEYLTISPLGESPSSTLIHSPSSGSILKPEYITHDPSLVPRCSHTYTGHTCLKSSLGILPIQGQTVLAQAVNKQLWYHLLGDEHLVCRLKKSLYGLKQSPRKWYKRFDSYMIHIGYKSCEYDCCVYVKSLDDGSFIFLLLYVDDMLIAGKNLDDVAGLKALLSQEFDMKDLGDAKKILWMEIHKDRSSKKLWLSRQGYVEKVLDRFGMSSAKPVSTPLANHFKLSSNQCPKTWQRFLMLVLLAA